MEHALRSAMLRSDDSGAFSPGGRGGAADDRLIETLSDDENIARKSGAVNRDYLGTDDGDCAASVFLKQYQFTCVGYTDPPQRVIAPVCPIGKRRTPL